MSITTAQVRDTRAATGQARHGQQERIHRHAGHTSGRFVAERHLFP
jgi:hypothetical protein